MCLTKLVISRLHEPVAQIHRAIGAGTTFAGDRTGHRHDVDERRIHVLHPPAAFDLALLSHLVLLDFGSGILGRLDELHGVWLFLLVELQSDVTIQVLFPHGTRTMHVFRHDHPLLR